MPWHSNAKRITLSHSLCLLGKEFMAFRHGCVISIRDITVNVEFWTDLLPGSLAWLCCNSARGGANYAWLLHKMSVQQWGNHLWSRFALSGCCSTSLTQDTFFPLLFHDNFCRYFLSKAVQNIEYNLFKIWQIEREASFYWKQWFFSLKQLNIVF